MSVKQTKRYTDLAGWWQLVSRTEEYADEAAFLTELFRGENAKTVLELGSGGGNLAWFLKRDFALTLTDISGSRRDGGGFGSHLVSRAPFGSQ